MSLAPVLSSLSQRLRSMSSQQMARLILASVLLITTVSLLPLGVGAAAGPVGVQARWGDSTALVTWQGVPLAAAYRVTLIRDADLAIMQQKTLPAAQLAWDAQGIWPNEQYQVAVQAVMGDGSLSDATLSAPGQSVPLSYAQYNGFLDKENVGAGGVNTNLWDEQVYDSAQPLMGDAFVNGQMHYHLQAGCPSGSACYGDQSVVTLSARAPLDLSGGRTATIHGEVDLKGDAHQWFGVILAPTEPGPDRVLDEVDRFYKPVSMPSVELFTFEGKTRLIYAQAGHAPVELASITNPIALNNVRDELLIRLSTSGINVQIDGVADALSATFPTALPFTTGRLTLFAEDYPHSGGTTQSACDDAPNDCSVWHLDNWGFDSPSPSPMMGDLRAFYSNGCAPYTGAEGVLQPARECASVSLSAPFVNVNRSVNVALSGAQVSSLVSAGLIFNARQLGTSGVLQAQVNSGPWVSVPYTAGSDLNPYNWQTERVDYPAQYLLAGANLVQYRLTGGNAIGAVTISDTEIETVSSAPFMPPTLPAEPAPLGTWSGGGNPATPTPTSQPSATATATPSPISISGASCVVTLNGQQETGTCTGTFLPAGNGSPTPPPTATPSPTATVTATATATDTPTPSPSPSATPSPSPTTGPTPPPSPSPSPTPQGARLAGINAEPSMRPWRYGGANPDGWWCAPPNCYQNADPMVTINAELSLAQQLGARYVRVEFPWALIETGSGVYDFSRADAIVAAASARGVELQPVLVFTPAWINSDPTQAPSASDFAAFVSTIVQRYHTSIHTWEMWNEPDHFHYWNAGEQAYVSSILIPGYQAAHAADPTCSVEIGAPSFANNGWLNTIYSDGGGSSFDIMAFHDYSGGGQVLADAQSVENVLSAHGQRAKPLWLGEYGVQEQSANDTQQQGLLRQVLLATNSPIAVADWYNLRDDFSMTCCPPAIAVSAFWGLVAHDDATLKAGFGVLQQLIAAGLPPHT